MTKPLPLKVGMGVSDGAMVGVVMRVDNFCDTLPSPVRRNIRHVQYAKVFWEDGQFVWENRYGLRKLPDRKEGGVDG